MCAHHHAHAMHTHPFSPEHEAVDAAAVAPLVVPDGLDHPEAGEVGHGYGPPGGVGEGGGDELHGRLELVDAHELERLRAGPQGWD